MYCEHNFQEMVDVGEDFLQEMRNIKDVCRYATNNFLGITLSTFDRVSQIEMQAGLEEPRLTGLLMHLRPCHASAANWASKPSNGANLWNPLPCPYRLACQE